MPFIKTDVNYATEYSRELQTVYPYLSYFDAVWASNNSYKYRPREGKIIAIPSITTSGAKAVNRDEITGSFSRNWNNEWQLVTMSMDREWDTIIDPMDIAETGDVATIANVTKIFNEDHKIPEQDCYASSKMSGFAVSAGAFDTTALTKDNILEQWDSYLAHMTNMRVNRDRIICYMTPGTFKLLKEAAGITRFVDVTTGIRDYDRNVGRLDGVLIREVPEELMKTEYDFTEDWAVKPSAKQINMLFVDPDAVAAPVVYDVSMMGAPTAQSKGKYIYYERYYYDVFALNLRAPGFFAHGETGLVNTLKSLSVDSVAGSASGKSKITFSGESGYGSSKFFYKEEPTATGIVTAGTPLDNTWLPLKSGDELSLTASQIINVAEANAQTLLPIASGQALIVTAS